MMAYTLMSVVYLVLALAAVVLLFWLVITVIRALNVYIAKNRPVPMDRLPPDPQ